ncbi:class I SAM-dependent methyltransferase [Pontibacter sp. Tf4]|uniref:class I SAM-dependent methyltransferase n=1 Tax=Pontibacter sp. Tf4 TaxID=2761620 RepID=UPI001624429D|nr:class I SAM-dependent methyltransferase [Pontibacter sp. Tf4]MBB6610336.1 class I SAM-dependent methyltransferase [Pontibacter sp. Tf4]
MIKKFYKKAVSNLPYVKDLKSQLELYHKLLAFPPGHYYSPIFDGKVENCAVVNTLQCEAIDLNSEEQLKLLMEFEKIIGCYNFPFNKTSDYRYYSNNNFYTGYDSLTLYCFLKKFKPKRIIEVGSGFSTALLLDVVDEDKLNTKISYIEPYPERLFSLISETDRQNVYQDKIQNINLELFSELNENDFLIIDTSHVSKTNSDVNHIIFKILPRLKKGVLIHFHDIFYPFEYPVKWSHIEKRSWNEIYILRAFLMYNQNFEITFFNHYLKEKLKDCNHPFFTKVPYPIENEIGSLWIKKIN